MEESLFYLALPEALREELDSLEKQGWLNREKGMLRIHPMVRLVCRTELKPTEENCKAFLRGIDNQYDEKQYDHEKFRQMAEVFETASNLLEDKTGFWASWAGYLWNQVAETQRALVCNLRSVQICEQHQPDSNNLATGYNNVGLTYGALGDHKQELEYDLKALAIREHVLPPEHPDLAASYNNVGMTYGDLGDHNQELEYQLKALAIFERVLPPEHPSLATSYNNVGTTYGALGEHKQALEYNLKALAIRERVLPGNHPDLALSYGNIALTNHALGRIGEAETHMRRAADSINRSALPENHPQRVNYNKWAGELKREYAMQQAIQSQMREWGVDSFGFGRR
jgi:preprotein translocase subunit SecA/nephrocystin-3